MILTELHGYKQYLDKDFYELMDVLSKSSYINDQGAFSVVVIPKTGDAVYKVWTHDPGYEAYYNLARKMQNNKLVPKMGRIHRLPIFFKRPDTVDGFLKIVKLERLTTLPLADNLAKSISQFLSIFIETKMSLTGFSLKHAHNDVEIFAARTRNPDLMKAAKIIDELVESTEDLFELAMGLRRLHMVSNDISFDLHEGNIMLRGNQPVIIDPLCPSRSRPKKGILYMSHLNTDIEALGRGVELGRFSNTNVKTGSRPSIKGDNV